MACFGMVETKGSHLGSLLQTAIPMLSKCVDFSQIGQGAVGWGQDACNESY